jgi:hypothetical protein
MLKWLLKSLIILAVFVPFSFALPLASVALCRTPDGAMFLFWAGPWSCCVLVLFYAQLSASKFWLGADHVRQWRAERGGLLHTSIIGCGWMFGALICSYAAESLLVFLLRGTASGRMLLPAATYSPLGFAWLWRHTHG